MTKDGLKNIYKLKKFLGQPPSTMNKTRRQLSTFCDVGEVGLIHKSKCVNIWTKYHRDLQALRREYETWASEPGGWNRLGSCSHLLPEDYRCSRCLMVSFDPQKRERFVTPSWLTSFWGSLCWDSKPRKLKSIHFLCRAPELKLSAVKQCCTIELLSMSWQDTTPTSLCQTKFESTQYRTQHEKVVCK